MAAVALWVAVWQVASWLVDSEIVLPGPWETLRRLGELALTAPFWATVLASAARVALGFVAGFALALALGLLSARRRAPRRLLAPALAALRSVPLACVIVLLLLWVGSRRVSAVAVFLVTFPSVYYAVLEGADARDRSLGELLGAFGVGRVRRLLADGWQQLLPHLVGCARNVCGMAWKAGVAAEVIGSPPGTVGERVYQAKLLLETADLLAWTVAVVVASWACERAFVALLEGSGPLALRLALAGLGGRAGRAGAGAGGATPEPLGLSHATLGHAGGPVVARDASLSVPAGSRHVLLGPSGAGKTTLVLTLAGVLAPLGGRVRPARRPSLVCQEARLVEGMDAVGNVALAAGCAPARAEALVRELLGDDVLGRAVGGLSGGQRRRVELVRALAHPSGSVLLDEPFSGLDAASREASAAFVMRHLGGRTLLVATHDARDAELLGAETLDVSSLAVPSPGAAACRA